MSTEVPTGKRRRWAVWGAAALAILIVVVAGVLWWAPSRYLPWDTTDFPTVDTSALSPDQARIVELLKTEHAQQRPGTFYAEGNKEPWCADFVSWVMREVGKPLANPNSGSWRIPGVFTLQEYYEREGRFEPVGNYTPSVGDIVIYNNSSWIGQHTNVVVAVDGDKATTVGGNEMGKIRVHTLDWASDSGVVGFGKLAT